MSSPSVLTQTIDKTHYIPAYTNEVAAFVGYFEKGPIDTPIFITDINQFKFVFGRGVDLHHNDWYQVYNYLQYASGLWVTRTSGNRPSNASNEDTPLINTKEEFEEVYETLDTIGLKIIAQTPGAWGNLLSVGVVSYDQWANNEEVAHGIYAQNLFTFFEKGYVAVCVFRKDKLVERFYKTNETIGEINSESRYIYIKYNTNEDYITQRIDCNTGNYLVIIDLNETQELSFPNDLDKEYHLLVKSYLQTLDCNIGFGKLSIYDLNGTTDLPFMNDLDVDSTAEESKNYYTYYGSNIIELNGGGSNFPTDIDISNSYQIFENTEQYDLDIIIGNDKHNQAAVALAEKRRDCIAFIGIPPTFVEYLKLLMGPTNPQEVAYTQQGLVIGIRETKIPYKIGPDQIKKLNEYLSELSQSQYVHLTMNIKEQLDGFTGNYKLVNIAGDTAGLKSQASLVAPWSVGAGLERGRIKNANAIYFNVKDVNTYYKKGLNYVENNMLMSQKTYYTRPSAFGRISTRSLFNHIEKEVKKLLRYYVFEENTYRVRGIIASTVKRYLEDVKTNRGIDAGKVHVHGQGEEIIVDVYIKPTYVTEYIQLRMKNVGTDTISNILSNTIA